MKEKKILTKKGLLDLKKELDTLLKVERPQNILDIKEAASLGDLSENAQYTNARERQSKIEGRIAEITRMIKSSTVLEVNDKNNKVGVGEKVKVYNITTEKEFIFEIVGSGEADTLKGKISYESPIGSALLNRKIGDTVTIKTPTGKIQLKIIDLLE